MSYFSDNNNYLNLNSQSISYTSMLYNEDQDDDEMADEAPQVKWHLPTTIELQKEYMGVVKEH